MILEQWIDMSRARCGDRGLTRRNAEVQFATSHIAPKWTNHIANVLSPRKAINITTVTWEFERPGICPATCVTIPVVPSTSPCKPRPSRRDCGDYRDTQLTERVRQKFTSLTTSERSRARTIYKLKVSSFQQQRNAC